MGSSCFPAISPSHTPVWRKCRLRTRKPSGCPLSSSPGYKERLQTKYLKEKNKNQLHGPLNSHQWRFLKNGLDDFRDGYPSPAACGIFTQNEKGCAPVVLGATGSVKPTEQTSKKRFNKEQICYSKVTPLQQMRHEYIAQIEYGLTQHPLALYPHLEESLAPEVFEEVVNVLDPEMHPGSQVGSSVADVQEEQDEIPSSQQETKETDPSDSKGEQSARFSASAISEDSKQKNPYKWLSAKEESEEKEKKTIHFKRASSPSLDEEIQNIAKEFCEWVTSLGGESSNIEESTLINMFGSGYKVQPALTVPIEVVELYNVPAELRMSIGGTPPSSENKLAQKKRTVPKKPLSQPNHVKIKYGAWYLDPKKWKKRNVDEPLTDPDFIRDLIKDENFDSLTMSERDEELKQLHGTKAFKDFIRSKGAREPKFLKNLFSEEETGKYVKDKKEENRNEQEGTVFSPSQEEILSY
ncbi:FA47E protein, partial [Polypterus senegalus]